MPAIRWKNGDVTEGRTWADVLAAVNALPWNSALTEDELRLELAERAHTWSLAKIDPWLPAREFFMELARAGMFEIESRHAA